MEFEVVIRVRISAPNDHHACLIADEMAEAVELAWMRNDDATYREAQVQCNPVAA